MLVIKDMTDNMTTPSSGISKYDLVFNNRTMNENYEPHKNGYFVCKDNLLITNTNLCRRYQSNKLENFNTKSYNPNCAKCTINLNAVKGRTLTDYNLLSIELQEAIEFRSLCEKREIYREYNKEIINIKLPVEQYSESLIDDSNY